VEGSEELQTLPRREVQSRIMDQPDDVTLDTSENGWQILRRNEPDGTLQMDYAIYNRQCFENALPTVRLYWAQRITQPNGRLANAVYFPGDAGRRYIAIDDRLEYMLPLDRLCLLHEMIHLKLGTESHGEDFVSEFKRVLDANKWEVMGCIDDPAQSPTAAA
jgi:hypothetical protein